MSYVKEDYVSLIEKYARLLRAQCDIQAPSSNEQLHDFTETLYYMKRSHAVQRAGWGNPNLWIRSVVPYMHEDIIPYMMMFKSDAKINVLGECYTWQPTQQDIFAKDWIIADVNVD